MASRVGEGDTRAAQGRRDDYLGHTARLGLAAEPLDRSRDPSEAESEVNWSKEFAIYWRETAALGE